MTMTDDVQIDKEALPQSGEGQQLFGITILQLRFTSCRYVIGQNENDEPLFCGEVIHRVSYCRTHYAACYVQKKPVR